MTEQEDLALGKYTRIKGDLSNKLFERDKIVLKIKPLLDILSGLSSGTISTINVEKIKEYVEQLAGIEHDIRILAQQVNEQAGKCNQPNIQIR